MLDRTARIALTLAACALLAACGSPGLTPSATPPPPATPPPAPTAGPPAATSTLAPPPVVTVIREATRTPPPTADPALLFPPTAAPVGELLNISGKGPFVSQPIELTAETNLRITWSQSSTGEFLLSFANLDKSMENTPYGYLTYDYSVGPSGGSSDASYVAGKYVVKVEKSDGPWQILVTVVPSSP